MDKKALITGITGQDGAFLSKLLLKKGYQVYGTCRPNSSPINWRLKELNIHNEIKMVPLELFEYSNIIHTIDKIRPDEIYNLGAQSFVSASFEQPIYTSEVNALGVLRLLEVIRNVNPEIKFYQASSSELYGKAIEFPQSETTPFYPRSPYSVAKQFAHSITINYREAYNLHASAGILFNHESEFRGTEFVTRKITSSLAMIWHNKLDVLELGNINIERDWGYAKDYVCAMWKMLQQKVPGEFVIATGKSHTLREFISIAADTIGFKLEWSGEGTDEFAIEKSTGKKIIKINEKYFRLTDVDRIVGNPKKANEELKWKPSVSFEELVQIMAKTDYDRVKNDKLLI